MRQSDSGLGWFLIGAGIGVLFSAAAVMLAAELTRRRYYRDPVTGEVKVDEYDPLSGLSDTMHTGLSILAGAAAGVTETFSQALREKIRFGLDPAGGSGGGSQAWYTGEDE